MKVRLTREYVQIERDKSLEPTDARRWVAEEDVETGDSSVDYNTQGEAAADPVEPVTPAEPVAADEPAAGDGHTTPKAIFFPIGTVGVVKGFLPREHRGKTSRVLVEMTGLFGNAESVETGTFTTAVRVNHVEVVNNGGRPKRSSGDE